MRLPDRVVVTEVGPRDGLQNEPSTIPTEAKVRLIEALADAGFARIEATSFVSPQWIPQLADADQVLRRVRRRPGLILAALVPNLKGLQRALQAKVDEVVIFLSASESHSRKNLNKSLAEALKAYRLVAAKAKGAGLRLRAAISVSFGCPYEGDVDPGRVVEIARELAGMGAQEISLADTTGMANPYQVTEMLERLRPIAPLDRISLHLHNTRGTGLANVVAGLQAGVTRFDASVAGLGGCPYAQGATGNISSEDLVHMVQEMGVSTGVDLERLLQAARLARDLVGRADSYVLKAGPVRHQASEVPAPPSGSPARVMSAAARDAKEKSSLRRG